MKVLIQILLPIVVAVAVVVVAKLGLSTTTPELSFNEDDFHASSPQLHKAKSSNQSSDALATPIPKPQLANSTASSAPSFSTRPPPAAPPCAPVVHTPPPSETPDLFGLLRNTSGRKLADPDWGKLREAFRHLRTITAGGIDPQTGRLIIIGEYAEQGIGLELDDFLIALRASFREPDAVGMTFNEDPNNKKGPTMFVEYFAGTQDTHLGMMMFECDRLMKCLGQGKDNITKQPLRATFSEFRTKLDIVRALREDLATEQWNRFWLNISTERMPDNDPRGKPVVEVSSDGHMIHFLQHRVYIDTRMMKDPGKGRRLEDYEGGKSKSSLAFANQLTSKYAELGKDFPVFNQIYEASKLVVLADWIRDSHQDFDWEMLHVAVDKSVKTPTATPSLSSEVSWEEGNTVATISAFGGVTLESKTQVAKTGKGDADRAASTVRAHRSEMRDTSSVVVESGPGQKTIVLGIGPLERAPPAEPKAYPPVRWTQHADSFQPAQRSADDSVLGRYELPVWKVAGRSGDSLEIPVLRAEYAAVYQRTETFTSESGATLLKFKAPDGISITSPSRDINIRFSKRPSYDDARHEAYYTSDTPNVLRYYPKSNTIECSDHSVVQFDAHGLVSEVRGADKPRLTFTHLDYRDGSLASEVVAGNAQPRAPPLRVTEMLPPRINSPGQATAAASPEDGPILWHIKNEDNGREMDIRNVGGQIHFVLK